MCRIYFLILLVYCINLVSNKSATDKATVCGHSDILLKNIPKISRQSDSTVEISCKIHENLTANPILTPYNVTWNKRGVNCHMYEKLSHNQLILSHDKRYLVKFEQPDLWILKIRYSKPSDIGIYECITFSFILIESKFSSLNLEEAHTEIQGGSSKMVYVNETLRLSCILRNSIERPLYIFWYKYDRVINYDLEEGATIRRGRFGSELIFPRAKKEHAGNYSCVPANAAQSSIVVHINDNPKKTRN